jgi:putative membrane protein
MIENFFSLFAGIALGIFTGLVPGIHVNLVAASLLAISPLLLQYLSPLSLGIFIVSLSVTHSFLDTIPSIYLGAPENENALSVLPGQKMLLQGEAHLAVKLTILGTYFGLITAVLLIPLFILSATFIFTFLKPYLLYLLVILIVIMISRGDWFWNLTLFMLSGTLGIIVFSMQNLKEPLFPLLSGLFGISGLMISYFENAKIPTQRIDTKIDIIPAQLAKAIAGSSIAVFLIQFFPGLGPAQGAVISNQVIPVKEKAYLSMVGAMGTMSVIFSLVTFYTLGKAKDGSIVVLSKLMELDLNRFMILVATLVVAGSVSVILVLFFSRIFSSLISKVNYKMLVVCVIIFIFLVCLMLNGPSGLIVLLTASAIGLISPLKGVARSHAMGCLLLPVIMYLIL